MSKRKLILLLAITILAIIAAVVTSKYRSPTTAKEKTLLFPELSTKINDITGLVIQEGKNSLTLVRDGQTWGIKESDNYPALFGKIKQTIIAVAELNIIAPKTSDPALYPRLGVEGVDVKDSTSYLLTLQDASNQAVAALIVGKSRHSKSSLDNPGLYVRLPDQEQALLVEGRLDMSVKVTDWFNRDLFDIPSERIREITIEHSDNTRIRLSRDSEIDDFVMADIPSGKKIMSDVILKRMGTMLESLVVDDVRAADKVELPQGATKATLKSFDGLIVTITSTKLEGVNFSQFAFEYDPASATQQDAEDENSGEENEQEQDKIDVQQQAQQLNSAVSGWVYKVPDYKFELFTKKTSELVKDK